MDGLEEDAAKHGTRFAALVAMLVDEGAEPGHGGTQILIHLEVCWDLDCHLISLKIHRENLWEELTLCNTEHYPSDSRPGNRGRRGDAEGRQWG